MPQLYSYSVQRSARAADEAVFVSLTSITGFVAFMAVFPSCIRSVNLDVDFPTPGTPSLCIEGPSLHTQHIPISILSPLHAVTSCLYPLQTGTVVSKWGEGVTECSLFCTLPLRQSTFLYRCLLILPYSPRQGSHRWATHDTVSTNHEVNAAFTRPRYTMSLLLL